MMTDTNLKPLDGVKVLEFGQIAAGPFAGSLLADLGADVVKVERPDGGDGFRAWPWNFIDRITKLLVWCLIE